MHTLHIEHRITDYAVWKAAFDRFAESRATAGVLTHRIARPVDEDHWIVVDLDFAECAQAERFLTFLRNMVWARPEASPGLGGDPQARIQVQEELHSLSTR